MKKLHLVDDIIKEPLGGAHSDRETTFKTVAKQITTVHDELKKLSPTELVNQRMDKYANMGVFKN